MSSDDRYRSTRPGLFEFLTTVGMKYQVYPKLFGYPRLLEIARKFDHLSLQEKGEFIERLIRGYRMRRHFTPDSEVPLLTKGTRIRTENGGRVRFGRSVRLNGARIFVGSRGNAGDGILVIGDRTEIGQTKLNVIAPLTIGADCLIAASSIMTTNFHHLEGAYGYRRDAPVTIADHVWVCEGAILLPGTNIGRDSVIGAGAVVRGHIPSNVLVAGNPAKVVGPIRGWHA